MEGRKRKEGARELHPLEEGTSPARRGPPPSTCPACGVDGLVSARAKSEDGDDGPGSHGDTSLQPVAGQSAQMAHNLSEVRVRGSNLAMDTLPRLGGPPYSPRAPALSDQVAITRWRLMAMSPKEPDLGQGSPPSAGLTRQSTVLFLPDTGGWCRLTCNLLTVLGFLHEKAGVRPSSVGSTEPPARASAEGTALLHMGWP